jgi:hypothetical protein
MTFANRLKVAENLPISSREGFQRNSRPTFWLKSIFVGPNGLRAGWRVLMFIALFAVLFGSFVLIRAGGLQGFREQYRNQSHITITPLVMGGSEEITLLFLSVAALVMGKLEHRKFGCCSSTRLSKAVNGRGGSKKTCFSPCRALHGCA